MKKQFILWTALLAMIVSTAMGQKKEREMPSYRKFFIGSTMFVLGNFIPDDPNPPDFVQLNVGYRLTPKDVVSIELKTWKYAWPLGIPYGPKKTAPDEKYPGYTRDVGFALVYQRFLWKGLYAAVHAMNARQSYYDDADVKIQSGYQLFMTYRLGYHIPLFKNRFFLEPSVALTHWPIKTNVPNSFAEFENRWNNTFYPEPGLHFGFKF